MTPKASELIAMKKDGESETITKIVKVYHDVSHSGLKDDSSKLLTTEGIKIEDGGTIPIPKAL